MMDYNLTWCKRQRSSEDDFFWLWWSSDFSRGLGSAGRHLVSSSSSAMAGELSDSYWTDLHDPTFISSSGWSEMTLVILWTFFDLSVSSCSPPVIKCLQADKCVCRAAHTLIIHLMTLRMWEILLFSAEISPNCLCITTYFSNLPSKQHKMRCEVVLVSPWTSCIS